MKSILFSVSFLGLLSFSVACSAQTQTSDATIEVIDYNSSAGKGTDLPQKNDKGIVLSTDKNSLEELKALCLKSKATWEKQKSDDLYSYKNLQHGGSYIKEVTFKGNDAVSLIIHRNYGTEETTQTELNVRTQKGSYELKGIRSIDKMYEYCLNELFSMSITDNTIYFGIDENGIINLYGYFPEGCADGCLQGQSIEEFAWK
ncbi:hypothetical protein ACE193_22845 [Bernardetia sp. OM2101]|uniref:hypothetical protein n=1 Tax=Bernardetia sp. OM2101 TaxID=3344876 RepID=UPI0035CEF67D